MGSAVFCANSRLDLDTVTVTSEDTDFPKENLFDDRVFTIFKPSGNPDPLDVITDAGANGNVGVDYFGLVGHNLATQSASINFAHSADNVTYTTIFTVTPSTDLIVFRTFPAQFDRFFRIRITGQTATPSLGQLQWGLRVEPPFGIQFSGFDPQDETINVRFNQSQQGNILGSIFAFAQRRARMTIPLLPDSFIRDLTVGGFQDFYDNHASKLKPFFFNWNTDNKFADDAFFGILDPRRGVRRPLRTPLDSGFRDLQMEVIGLRC